MSIGPHFAPGTFCWADLATTEPDTAKSFYQHVFGWEAEDLPTAAGEPYTMLRKGDRDVAGLGGLAPGMAPRPRWQSYLAVLDVNASTARAEALGGRVLMAPADVMGLGRMALVQDPGGAAVGLWQAGRHGGAQLVNAVGACCWHELRTRVPEEAARFYGSLLGWQTRISASMPGGQYRIFGADGRDLAGMLPAGGEAESAPAGWTVYFGVRDCDAAIAAVESLGGSVLLAPMEVEKIGRFAALADPLGAAFAIIQFADGHK